MLRWGGRSSLGSLDSQPPCLLILPLPLLLTGTGGWQAVSWKAGRPCTGPPGHSPRSCRPSPQPLKRCPGSRQGPPAASVKWPHQYKQPAENGSAPWAWPRTVSAPERRRRRQTLALRQRGCQPRRALTRRRAGSRSSHPAAGWASASCRRGRARAGVALLWRRSCSWRRLRGGWRLSPTAVPS